MFRHFWLWSTHIHKRCECTLASLGSHLQQPMNSWWQLSSWIVRMICTKHSLTSIYSSTSSLRMSRYWVYLQFWIECVICIILTQGNSQCFVCLWLWSIGVQILSLVQADRAHVLVNVTPGFICYVQWEHIVDIICSTYASSNMDQTSRCQTVGFFDSEHKLLLTALWVMANTTVLEFSKDQSLFLSVYLAMKCYNHPMLN